MATACAAKPKLPGHFMIPSLTPSLFSRWAGFAARTLWPRLRRPCVVLLYHRVTDLSPDPWGLAVSPRNFSEQLSVLCRRFSPIGLSDLVDSISAQKIPRGHVAVTFDDGYRDNFEEAWPALRAAQLPATFFITSCALDAARELWWDELGQLFLEPGELPARMEISGRRSFSWQLKLPGYTAAEAAAHRHWRVFTQPPSDRQALYFALWEKLIDLPHLEQRGMLDQLFAWAGRTPTIRPSHRLLSSQELLSLAAEPLVEIGAHTLHHSALPTLPEDQQRAEILGNKESLEKLLGRPLRHFSYPYGRHSPAVGEIARASGFVSACTTESGAVTAQADLLQIPRVYARNVGGAEFERELEQVLRDAG